MGDTQLTRLKEKMQILAWPAVIGVLLWGTTRYIDKLDRNNQTTIDLWSDVKIIKQQMDFFRDELGEVKKKQKETEQKMDGALLQIREDVWELKYNSRLERSGTLPPTEKSRTFGP